ncbi:unnamed protein product [Candidula unifasciata]|uniref:RGS domain-containing protein n=1 Tax=Candidula unifasciata TaxID=100452 RepID=A0A8S3YMA0_9EUPU|nr:unnamed protein product [Candidula unifasciata]
MPLFRRKTAEKQAKPPTSVPVLPGSDVHRSASSRSNRSLPHSPSTPDSWGEGSSLGIPCGTVNGNVPGEKRPRTLMLTESVLQDGQDILADSLESPLRTSSRLSKTLLEVIRDKDALACFKSFLSGQKADHLIQFWCDAESFHASTLTRMRTHTLQSLSKSSLHKRRSNSFRQAADIPCEAAGIVSSSKADANACDSRVLTRTDPQNSLGSVKYQERRHFSESSACEEGYSKRLTVPDGQSSSQNFLSQKLDNLSSKPSSDSAQRRTDDKASGVFVYDHTHKPPDPESSAFDISKSSTERRPVIEMLDVRCGSPSSSTLPVGPSELNLTATNSQHMKPAALSQQPSDAEEPGVLKSPSELSQEDIAQRLKKSIERDAVTIFSTYIAKDAPQPIGVDDMLRSDVISKICKENGEVDPECFLGCQRFALNRLDVEYFQSFRDSEFHCRHQVNVLTTEKVYLADILFNENALCYFMEYMEQEGASDLMQMWLAADNFQQQLTSTTGCYDPEQAQNDAMVIYDRYFSLQATNPIGFDDKLRFEVEGNICREGGPLPDCFTKAKNIVLKILDKVYFAGYLQGHIYYRYLSDLLSTVQISEDMPSKHFLKGHRRAESDASSEHSVGSQSTGAESVVSRNTLLAVDTRKLRKGSTIEGDFSMSMDMFNPDVLWKRPDANNLSLGCVNELGQFVSRFEHGSETEKKKGPILFKRRKDKEKEEEEMALRIARMIISDVNTMTKTGETMLSKPNS